jgi:hypothetical protein
MPRRLGDDPLSRKKSPSSKERDAPSPGLHAQQASHNDVFFQRRIEGPNQKLGETPVIESSPGETTSSDEKPEITEVSDIVRTAKAAESTQGAELLSRPMPMDESVQPLAEEPVEDIEQTPPRVSEHVTSFEPPSPATQGQAAPVSSQSEPQPQKGEGFFKRLFGRFGK